MRSCATCDFADLSFADDDGSPLLVCRRFPPLLLVEEDQTVKTWPSVNDSDWCGEWQEAPA